MRKPLLQLLGILVLSVAVASCYRCRNGNIGDSDGNNGDTTRPTLSSDDSAAMDMAAKSMAAPLDCYPDSCEKMPQMCNDSCKLQISRCHEIRPVVFGHMTSGYSTDGYLRIKDSISSMMDTATCDSHWVQISGDTTKPGDNSDIRIEVKRLTKCQKDQRVPVRYSVALFKGILLQTPTNFYFFKAKKLNCVGQYCNDIIMKVQFENGTTKNYDVSDIPPPVCE